MNRLLPLACAALCACPEPVMLIDAGHDAGPIDAGVDAGRPMHDAGVADAGFMNVEIAEWCSTTALAQCQRDQRCGRIDDMTMAGCLHAKTFVCDAQAYVRSFNEHKLGYDTQAATRCANAYGFGSCELTPPDCAHVFTGLTPPLGSCYVPEDCDPDAGFCDPYDFLCPHRCSAFVDAGATCSDPFAPRCAAGLGCDYPLDGGSTTICVPAHQNMQPCQMFDSCAAGLTCTSGMCLQQYANEGEACFVTDGFPYCQTNAFCRQPPPPTPGGVSPPGICERRAGLGGTCFGYGSCLPSLRCSSAIGAGTCLRFAAMNEPCSNNFYGGGECQDGLYCPPRTSRCAPLPTDGGDCSETGSYFECAAGYSCNYVSPSYQCQALRADNAPCDYDSECLSNECVFGTAPDGGFGGVCVRCSQVADAGS